MKVFEKLKNALFEEEYGEVEEKPKTVAKKKKKVKVKEPLKEKEVIREEKPIAKKVILPEKKEPVIDDLQEEELIDEDFEIKPREPVKEEVNEEVHRSFRMMDDDDFKVESNHYHEVEPQIVKVIEKKEESVVDLPANDSNPYSTNSSKPKEKHPYGLSEEPKIEIHEYGGYDRKEERSYFKPSPIISPIYGILDKNYKKEEIVSKREVRLTSSYTRENVSVDDVRRKAFGDLSDDIARGPVVKEKEEEPTFEVEEDNSNLLVDLSADDEKPSVKEVTVGDALEYFQDLGLEYNVDYVDASKEKSVGRRVKDHYEKEVPLDSSQKLSRVETTDVKQVEESNKVDIDSDDNLFDLIDSMYQENE